MFIQIYYPLIGKLETNKQDNWWQTTMYEFVRFENLNMKRSIESNAKDINIFRKRY